MPVSGSAPSLLASKRRLLDLLTAQEHLKEAVKRQQKMLLRLNQDKYFLSERLLQRREPGLTLDEEEEEEKEEKRRKAEEATSNRKKRRSLLREKRRREKELLEGEGPGVEQEGTTRKKRKYKKRRPKESLDVEAGASSEVNESLDPASEGSFSEASISFASAFSRSKHIQSIRRPYQMGVNRQPKKASVAPNSLLHLQRQKQSVIRSLPSFPHPPSGEVPGNLFEDEDEEDEEGNEVEEDDGLDVEEELLGGEDEEEEEQEVDVEVDHPEEEEEEEELRIDED